MGSIKMMSCTRDFLRFFGLVNGRAPQPQTAHPASGRAAAPACPRRVPQPPREHLAPPDRSGPASNPRSPPAPAPTARCPCAVTSVDLVPPRPPSSRSGAWPAAAGLYPAGRGSVMSVRKRVGAWGQAGCHGTCACATGATSTATRAAVPSLPRCRHLARPPGSLKMIADPVADRAPRPGYNPRRSPEREARPHGSGDVGGSIAEEAHA